MKATRKRGGIMVNNFFIGWNSVISTKRLNDFTFQNMILHANDEGYILLRDRDVYMLSKWEFGSNDENN